MVGFFCSMAEADPELPGRGCCPDGQALALKTPLMRNGSVMASLPCNLKGQRVYLLVFQLLFIYYIVMWKRRKKRKLGYYTSTSGWLCFMESFYSLLHFKSSCFRLFFPLSNLYQGCAFVELCWFWWKDSAVIVLYIWRLCHLFSCWCASMSASKLSPYLIFGCTCSI